MVLGSAAFPRASSVLPPTHASVAVPHSGHRATVGSAVLVARQRRSGRRASSGDLARVAQVSELLWRSSPSALKSLLDGTWVILKPGRPIDYPTSCTDLRTGHLDLDRMILGCGLFGDVLERFSRSFGLCRIFLSEEIPEFRSSVTTPRLQDPKPDSGLGEPGFPDRLESKLQGATQQKPVRLVQGEEGLQEPQFGRRQFVRRWCFFREERR